MTTLVPRVKVASRLALLTLPLVACHGAPEPELPVPDSSCQALMWDQAEAEVQPVKWILAPDAADRLPLDRWCAGVGPAVTLPSLDVRQRSVDSLLVISWNTHVGGGDIPGLVEDIRSGDLTDGVPVQDFVLLLQEVYRAGAEVPRNTAAAMPGRITETPPNKERIDIVETARRLGLCLYYVPSMANGRAPLREAPEDRGNAILSTLPLDQLGAIELPYEVQRRVAAVATVRGTTSAGQSWALDLASVHLDHRSRWARILSSVGAGRERQARALVSALEGTESMALGGDLNTWAGFLEGASQVLRQFFPRPEQIPVEPTFGTSSGTGGLRLDRLMFRLPEEVSVTTRRLRDRRGSDHHPLLGWVSFAGA